MLNGKGEVMSFDDKPEGVPVQMLIKAHLKATEAGLGLKHNQIVSARKAVMLRLEYGDKIFMEKVDANNSQRIQSDISPDAKETDNGSS